MYRLFNPALECPPDLQLSLGGWVGECLRINELNWLIPAPATNPGMLEMFAHRDNLQFVNGRGDARDPVPWAGEFAGKYLLSAVQSLRLTGNAELEGVVRNFVAELLTTQGTDGSLGMPLAWDLWGQYHVMLGLLRWYEHTVDREALAACQRAANLMCARYLRRASAIAADHHGDDEKNQAVAHVLALLYEHTGEANYLELVHAIEAEWSSQRCFNQDNSVVCCGDFICNALALKQFYEGTRPRWESLHDIQAIAELYFITGDSRYQTAFEQIWFSIRDHDRHATGGFTSGEAATGNPYDPRYIETCGTVAWMALTIDMLRLKAESIVADELELSLFNAILGAQSPDGRHWTYHTPMGGIPTGTITPATRLGYRLPAYYDLAWQSRDRYPQLSCCAANGPRGIGCLSEWAIMRSSDAIVVNYYGPATAALTAPNNTQVTLTQETAYPFDGTVRITVTPANASVFAIRVRIPAWSRTTQLNVNGTKQSCSPGTYCEINREWHPDDVITLTFDMSVRLVAGESYAQGLSVAYRGPILLSYDTKNGAFDPLSPPTLSATPPPRIEIIGETALRASFSSSGGEIALRDFAGAAISSAANLTGQPDMSGVWQFSRSDGTVLAEQVQFSGDGTISGYSHPNEVKWGFEGDDLTFYAAVGVASTRFTFRALQHGKPVFSGMSLLDRSIRHVLSQVDLGVVGKTWQFRRLVQEGVTVLQPVIRLLPGGAFDSPTNANETRWGMEGATLVFYAANGAASTRFTSIQMHHGRVQRRGLFLFDSSITHELAEVDSDVMSMVWRFIRQTAGNPDVVIADKIRLLSNQRLDGYWHPNESRWDYAGNMKGLVFLSEGGAVSTQFDKFDASGGVMRFKGSFADGSITHVLEESTPGWMVDDVYVSWLPFE